MVAYSVVVVGQRDFVAVADDTDRLRMMQMMVMMVDQVVVLVVVDQFKVFGRDRTGRGRSGRYDDWRFGSVVAVNGDF